MRSNTAGKNINKEFDNTESQWTQQTIPFKEE